MDSLVKEDLDLEQNPNDSSAEAEEPSSARVSLEGSFDKKDFDGVGGLNLNAPAEIRVSPVRDLDEIRVLDKPVDEKGARVLGEAVGHSGVDGETCDVVEEGNVSGDVDGEIELRFSSNSSQVVECREGGDVAATSKMGVDNLDARVHGVENLVSLDVRGDGTARPRADDDDGNDRAIESDSMVVEKFDTHRDGTARSRADDDDDVKDRVIESDSMVVDKFGAHKDSRDYPRAKEEGAVGEYWLEDRNIGPYEMLDGKNGSGDGAMTVDSGKVSGSRFEMGDMVWGKVKSHPWWPGHIFSETFASSSVRRTRRDGHVLVAFFGDSSYGWFDPEELIPYEPNYDEKSQQTISRNFVKAVEDSVDEVSRRSALGLSCRCRNAYNFRRTNVRGYLAVDVFDYEPGGIYSVRQIQEARDSFQPAEALSYIKKLALGSRDAEDKCLDFIKNKAVAFAYRKAVFEEFDEPYAQAFGQQSAGLSHLPSTYPNQHFKEPAKASLSGPLVVAEALGGRKISAKAAKLKEQPKKDRYLFKRRDEPSSSRSTQISQWPSSPSAREVGGSDSTAAGYLLQKRDQAASVNDATVVRAEATPSPAVNGTEASISGISGMVSNSQQSESSVSGSVEVCIGPGQGPHDANLPGANGGSVKKTKKAPKRRPEELSSGKPDSMEKKKKKHKKSDDGARSDLLEKKHPGRADVVKPAAKPVQIAAASTEDIPKMSVKASNSATEQSWQPPLSLPERNEAIDVPQMLHDLQALAVDHFHGIERNVPAVVRQFFLRFRSHVFQKSLSASLAPADPESGHESRSIRLSLLTSTEDDADQSVSETGRGVLSKVPRPSGRPDDPTKSGRKRVPSERQEEIAAKRAKKVLEAKSLGAEKRAALKTAESERADGKGKVAALPPSRAAPRTELPVKKTPPVEEPTILSMKYPPGSSLPSLVELKARFARFGPLDTSRSRVFYQTNVCRVIFLYKADAQNAYKHAVANKSVFSNVRFMLKPVAAPAPAPAAALPEPQEPARAKPEEPLTEAPLDRDSAAETRLPVQPIQQLRSCLKKPSGDEAGGPMNGSCRGVRVRFNVDGDDTGGSNRVVMDTGNSDSKQDAGPSSSPFSVAMDVSKNQRFISSSHSLPSLPPPPRTSNLNHNIAATAPPPPPPPPSIDISQQMMSLLMRCHDVVTGVKSILGYVPYHPL